MEGLPTLAHIDEEIIQSKRVFIDNLGIECKSSSALYQSQL